MKTSLLHIVSRVFMQPLLIAPANAEAIANVLRDRIPEGLTWSGPPDTEINRFFGSHRRETRPGSVVPAESGTAVISIVGELVNRGAWVGANSGLVSYEGTEAQLRDAAADPEIESIILDLDTPGGEGGGIASLGALIRDIRKDKRVVAVVNDNAMSGGQWIAAQASEVVVSPTSRLGSIGVVMLHLDRSQEAEDRGIKPTFIYAGANKINFSPFGPLSEEARQWAQEQVSGLYDLFCAEVGAGRGDKFTAERARETEAAIIDGRAAVEMGLADRLGTFADVLAQEVLANPTRRAIRHKTASQKVKAKIMADTPDRTAEEVANSAAEIAQLCSAAGFGIIAAGLIKANATVEQTKAKIEEAKQIKASVETARRISSAIDPKLVDQYLAAGTSLDAVKADLFSRTASASQHAPARSAHTVDGGSGAPTWRGEPIKIESPRGIYARRAKERAAHAAQLED